jgi:MFS family permease
VAAYAFVVTMLGTTLPTPLYPLYRERFHFSELMVTVIFATYAIGVLGALMLFGRVSDEVGRRLTLLGGIALSALSAVTFLLAQGLPLLFVGRVISGLSAGIFTGTATATLVDLAHPRHRGRGTVVATLANMGGLGLGPLLAGVLAEVAAAPLRLPFWVDLALLLPAVALVTAMPEPVQKSTARFTLRLQPLGVPTQARAVFVRAAIAGFAGFAVLGLFTAAAPGFLGQILDVHNSAVVGLVVSAVFAASTVGQTALQRAFGNRALVAGCGGLIAGMGLFAAGLASSSLALLVSGGVVAGLGQGLSFRRGLADVEEVSPPERRAEVGSSFFFVLYIALSVPIVGVGVVTELAGLRAAGLIFAAVVAALAATAVGLLLRRRIESHL